MARIKTAAGRERAVRNLGWFFRKARRTLITYLSMSREGQFPREWKMRAAFQDGSSFETDYASMTVFKEVMGRQRSLKGVPVSVIDGDDSYEFVLGRK